MRLRFLGTRGEIERRSARHRRHSALLVAGAMVDCGRDWLEELDGLAPRAVVLTHAHPDHAAGLRRGAPCPVFAPEATWAAIDRYPIAERRVVEPGRSFAAGDVAFEAVPLEHSLRAPAVGYRIGESVFYAPDVAAIGDESEALRGVALYVGDGAAIARSILRYREGTPIGHASIRAQLDWCAEAGVPRAVFTHCGSEIVRDHRAAAGRVGSLGRERGIRAEVACDGMVLDVRG